MSKNTSDILTLKDTLLTYYSSMHRTMDLVEQYYDLAFKISDIRLPEGVDPVIPSTSRAVIDNAVDHITSDYVIVKQEPKGRAKGSRELADQIEKVGQGFFYQLALRADAPPIQAADKTALIFGMAPVKASWDEDAWEKERELSFPYDVKVLDPRTVLPDPKGGRRPSYVIEVSRRPKIEITDLYPEWSNPKLQTELLADVEWIEYHDAKERVYIVDGEEVNRAPNPLGYPPYCINYSGLGSNVDGAPPEKRAIGLLWPILALLEMEARILSDIGAIIRYSAFAIPTVDSLEDAQRTDFTMKPGKLNIVAPSFKLLELMKFNPELLQLLGIVKGMIEAATYPGVLIGAGSMSSGYERAVAVRNASQKFAYLLSQTNYLGTWLLQTAFRYQANHPDKPALTVTGVIGGPRGKRVYVQETVKAEDVGDNLAGITVEFAQGDPLANQAKATLGANFHTQGKIAIRTLHEDYMGIENSSEEVAEIIAERVLFSDAIQQLLIQSVIQETGFQEMLQQEVGQIGETMGIPPQGQAQGGVFSEAETQFGIGTPTPPQVGELQQAGVWPPTQAAPRIPQQRAKAPI